MVNNILSSYIETVVAAAAFPTEPLGTKGRIFLCPRDVYYFWSCGRGRSQHGGSIGASGHFDTFVGTQWYCGNSSGSW